MIIKDCKSRLRNLSMVWINYCKALDSVPQSWILKILDLILINFFEINMLMWETAFNRTY